jgi:hypothetical protein
MDCDGRTIWSRRAPRRPFRSYVTNEFAKKDQKSSYLEMFPRATLAGNHSFDSKLEDFLTEKLARWVEVNQAERDRLTKPTSAPDLRFEEGKRGHI